MELSDLRQQYERLTDDELLRVWADKNAVEEMALSILTDEMQKRNLLDNAQAGVRIRELKHDLADNTRRFERDQRRIVGRVRIVVVVFGVGVLAALAMWLFSK